MNSQRLAAILLILGALAMVASFPVGLSRVYQIQDLQERVNIIERSMTRWNISQSLIALSALLTAVGFALLAGHLRSSTNGWLAILAALVFIVATISGVYFVYRQTFDPLSSYQGDFKTFEFLYYWLALAGLLLFGIGFLQAGLPAWLGYLTAGVTLIYGVYFAISSVGFPTPGLVTILTLVIGIVLL